MAEMKRRQFLTASVSALGASTLSAIEPIQRAGKSRMQLGLAAYSFRQGFEWNRGKKQEITGERKPWTIFDFIDYCADHDVPGAEVTAYYFPPDVDEAFLLKVKRHAYLRGVQLAGTAVNNNFAQAPGPALDKEIAMVKTWIDHAAVMSAPHIRVFAGPQPKDISEEEAVKHCTAAYQECLDYAGKKGVFLGLENHGGIVAKPENLVKMIQAVESPWAGINFDSGNFHTADPYADLEKIAPYAINVQLKMEIKGPDGKKTPSDIPRVLKILRDANYQGWFTIEYEEEDDAWVAIPKIIDQVRPLLAGL